MYKAMLKLTNSFCRFLKIAYENLSHNRTYIQSFSYLSCGRNLCSSNIVTKSTLLPPRFYNEQHLRLYSNKKKRFYIKKLTINAEKTKKNSPMSESLQPTVNHVSYGGQFEISPEDNSSGNNWKQFVKSETSCNAATKELNHIPPDFRIWETVGPKKNETEGNTFKFKVVSYNLLAQYLLECHPYLYTECAPYDLNWKVRAARLYDEIIKLAPDIICLQEVQASHLSTFYTKFEHIGYTGIYKKKTGHREDGCGIYFKHSLFELQDHLNVEFYQPELPILNRDNIGIIVKLLPKNYPASPIVVATTHLLYNPKRTDVRLAQMQMFLAEIDRFAYFNNGRESGHLPIILTGDFNSTPDSAVIQLLDRARVSASPFRDNSDWKKIGVTDNCQHLAVVLNRQDGRETEFSMTQIHNSDYRMERGHKERKLLSEDYSALFNSSVVCHSLNLTSVYDKYKEDGQYEATTMQDYWITVDYIYFSSCNIQLLERLRLPTANECEILNRLPNHVFGSDHLALGAVFEIKPCYICRTETMEDLGTMLDDLSRASQQVGLKMNMDKTKIMLNVHVAPIPLKV